MARLWALSVALAVLLGSALVPSALAQPAAPADTSQIQVNLTPSAAPNDSASALAAKFQNPIADLISFPLQNNTNFNVGPNRGTQDILNIQPVIPIHLNDDWNLITRTILPLVWSPSFQPTASAPPFGLSPHHVQRVLLAPQHGRHHVGHRPDRRAADQHE
jgi:hypothetical protein